MKMTRPSIRTALLVPVLSLGLLVPSLGPGQTQADTLPAPCAVADVVDPTMALDEQVLMLSVMASAESDPVPTAPRRPSDGVPAPTGELQAPKAPGTDLRPPPPALLNLEPILAARQLQTSLTEKQRADLHGVLAKHRSQLQQARAQLPEVTTDGRGTRAVQGNQEARLQQASVELKRIGEQVDQDVDSILTPQQRALLQKARPKRNRSELPLPEVPGIIGGTAMPGC